MKALLLITIASFIAIDAQPQDAKEIVRRADQKMRGEESGYSEMDIKIIRPSWERTISLKTWTKGAEYSLALVTAPAREEGMAYLKRGNDMWNWNPTINRMIKMPPSMLSQGWMGSDFTNDDLLNESSIVVDYTHKLIGSEIIENRSCHIIELTPLEDAVVVWGKIILWISKEEYIQMKAEYYDEDGLLVKTELSYDIREMDSRMVPGRFELVPADKEGNKTVVLIKKAKFNVRLEDDFFSQQNMKRMR